MDMMRPNAPIEGIRMASSTLPSEEVLKRVREVVARSPSMDALNREPMRPSTGYVSLVSLLSYPSYFFLSCSIALVYPTIRRDLLES